METLKKNYWKIACMLLLIYTIWAGFMGKVPRQAILNETVRNLYFHVTMWFTMIFLLGTSVYHSIQYLRKSDIKSDLISNAYVETGLVFATLGLVTVGFGRKAVSFFLEMVRWREVFDENLIGWLRSLAIKSCSRFIARASFLTSTLNARIGS